MSVFQLGQTWLQEAWNKRNKASTEWSSLNAGPWLSLDSSSGPMNHHYALIYNWRLVSGNNIAYHQVVSTMRNVGDPAQFWRSAIHHRKWLAGSHPSSFILRLWLFEGVACKRWLMDIAAWFCSIVPVTQNCRLFALSQPLKECPKGMFQWNFFLVLFAIYLGMIGFIFSLKYSACSLSMN